MRYLAIWGVNKLYEENKQSFLAQEMRDEGIVARYSGNFDEYEIIASKNAPGFYLIRDRVQKRDGSDLISDGIDKFIFKDVEKNYQELIGSI